MASALLVTTRPAAGAGQEDVMNGFRDITGVVNPSVLVIGDERDQVSIASLEQSLKSRPRVLILSTSGSADEEIIRLLSVARSAKQRDRQVFVLLYSPLASDSGSLRITCFNHGCNMVTASLPDAQHVLRLITGIGSRIGQGPYACPSCGLTGLTEDDLHEHYPLYHVNETNVTVCCPICSVTCEPRRLPFPPHLYNSHGPPSRRADHHSEEVEGRPLYAYALVVCRHPHTGRFLLVQEFSNSGYWLPGGRVDPEEDFVAAAVRETEEEAGVRVKLTGILRIEYEPCKLPRRPYQRMRVIFLACPADPGQLPKSIPNYESVGAVWATVEEIEEKLPLRGVEPKLWCPYVAQVGEPCVYPLGLLTREGAVPEGFAFS